MKWRILTVLKAIMFNDNEAKSLYICVDLYIFEPLYQTGGLFTEETNVYIRPNVLFHKL